MRGIYAKVERLHSKRKFCSPAVQFLTVARKLHGELYLSIPHSLAPEARTFSYCFFTLTPKLTLLRISLRNDSEGTMRLDEQYTCLLDNLSKCAKYTSKAKESPLGAKHQTHAHSHSVFHAPEAHNLILFI